MKTKNKINFSIGKQYFFSTIILFGFIAILYSVQDIIGYQTVSLILLLIVFLLPLLNFERGPIILSAIISALAWDYYFIPPHFTLHIAKAEDVMMLLMFFIVAITNGVLTARLREQKNEMINRERKSNALYNLLKDLSDGKDLNDVSEKTVKQIHKVFGLESVIFYSFDHNRLNREPYFSYNFVPDEMEWLTAEICFKDKKESGRETDILPDANAIYLPLLKDNSVIGVIGIKINDEIKSGSKEMDFLKNFINEIIPFIWKYMVYSIP
jgi:two-component system sensor histidine kinase KdpD